MAKLWCATSTCRWIPRCAVGSARSPTIALGAILLAGCGGESEPAQVTVTHTSTVTQPTPEEVGYDCVIELTPSHQIEPFRFCTEQMYRYYGSTSVEAQQAADGAMKALTCITHAPRDEGMLT